jgi:putative intracellular protease/amidase
MRLSIALYDGFTALDIVGGYEVLANVPGMEVEFVAATRGIVAADTRRLGLVAYRSFAEVHDTDILYVPGGPGVVPAFADEQLLAWLRKVHATTTWTVGICNGVALLAAAGVLTGCAVTTNWGWRERVAAYGVRVLPARHHRDGKIFTGAGVSASIDAALALTTLIAGAGVTATIRLGIEYYPEPPGGAGSADDAPVEAKALILAFEQRVAPARLAGVQPPFGCP